MSEASFGFCCRLMAISMSISAFSTGVPCASSTMRMAASTCSGVRLRTVIGILPFRRASNPPAKIKAKFAENV